MKEFSKSHKRRLRELSARLYELEMKESLLPLSRKFEEWKAGKITSLQLNQIVHDYDYGESRRVWSRFETNRHDMLVAQGFVKGFLCESEIGEELLKELEGAIAFCRETE